MFKALYGLSGTLAQPLTSVGTSIVLDDQTMAKITIGLANGTNYTYLIIQTAATYEVVLTQAFFERRDYYCTRPRWYSSTSVSCGHAGILLYGGCGDCGND